MNRKQFTRLFLLSVPMMTIIVSHRSMAQPPIKPYAAKTPDEKEIVALVQSRYPKMIVTRLAIANNYGLYSWVQSETGGQTVVKKNPTTKQWQFVRGTGGTLRVTDITGFGVPEAIAQRLVNQIQKQVQSPSP